MFTSPSAPVAAQKTYSKVLGWKSDAESAPTSSVRSTTAGPSGASNAVLDMLRMKGWVTPERQTEVTRKPEDLFDIERTQVLSPYAYSVSEPEWQRITDTFSNKEGFTPAPVEMALPAGYVGNLPPEVIKKQEEIQRVNARQPLMNPGTYQSAELTWDAYEKLSEEQRNRVDFNSLMVQAREKDLQTRYEPTEEQRAQYDEDVTAMFGEQGGSVVYAPETVSLLKQVDFKAVGQDLDEYLSLERLTGIDELKAATFSTGAVKQLKDGDYQNTTQGQTYADVRSEANLAALEAELAGKSAEAITTVMTDANRALQDFRTSMAHDRWLNVTALGGTGVLEGSTPAPGFTPLPGGQVTDFNDPNQIKSAHFNQLYNLARDKSLDMESWSEAGQINDPELKWTDSDWSELFNFFDTKTRQEQRWGQQMPGETGDDVRTPDEIRAMFGLKE